MLNGKKTASSKTKLKRTKGISREQFLEKVIWVGHKWEYGKFNKLQS